MQFKNYTIKYIKKNLLCKFYDNKKIIKINLNYFNSKFILSYYRFIFIIKNFKLNLNNWFKYFLFYN